MKFKIKINEETSFNDIRFELENLRTADVTEIPLNHLRKITEFLGAVEVPAAGSSVRFRHQALNDHPYYHGYFQIHKIHKGGDQDLIRKNDFKMILFPALITIIDLIEK
jgi:hypothetical protein